MKYYFIILLSLLALITSCSTTTPNTNLTIKRTLASDANASCTHPTSAVFTNEQMALCQIAYDYINQLIGSEFRIEMTNNVHESAKRNVIAINALIKKSDVEAVIGKGGLRMKYLRYLLNELSYHQTQKEFEEKKESKPAIYNFTLIELNLVPSE